MGTEAKVKVFGPARSTCVARVLVCLEEVGAEYELVHVHLPAGDHKGPAHLARTRRPRRPRSPKTLPRAFPSRNKPTV